MCDSTAQRLSIIRDSKGPKLGMLLVLSKENVTSILVELIQRSCFKKEKNIIKIRTNHYTKAFTCAKIIILLKWKQAVGNSL